MLFCVSVGMWKFGFGSVLLYPIPGSVKGQAGWGSEQPDLVEDVAVCVRGFGAQ